MYVRYYFLRNLLTGEKKMVIKDNPDFGEIGTCYGNWMIVDYAEDYLTAEDPEDF